MTQPNRQTVRQRTLRHRAATAWLAVALMLCNLLYSAAMMPMPALAGGDATICTTHHADQPGQQSHDPARHGSDCSCCLSMCCAGAALAGAETHAVPRPVMVASHDFTLFSTPHKQSAPSLGGGARAPPASA